MIYLLYQKSSWIKFSNFFLRRLSTLGHIIRLTKLTVFSFLTSNHLEKNKENRHQWSPKNGKGPGPQFGKQGPPFGRHLMIIYFLNFLRFEVDMVSFMICNRVHIQGKISEIKFCAFNIHYNKISIYE